MRRLLAFLGFIVLLTGSGPACAGLIHRSGGGAPPAIPTVISGGTAFGSWAPTAAPMPQGSPGAFGYNEQPGAVETTYPFQDIPVTTVRCVSAAHVAAASGDSQRGILAVSAVLDFGVAVQAVFMADPSTTVPAFCVNLDPAVSVTANRTSELRWLITPRVGQGLVLQNYCSNPTTVAGDVCTSTGTNTGFATNFRGVRNDVVTFTGNASGSVFKGYAHVNASTGNDATGAIGTTPTGTLGTPYKTTFVAIQGCNAASTAQGFAGDVGGCTIYHAAGTYEIGTGAVFNGFVDDGSGGGSPSGVSGNVLTVLQMGTVQSFTVAPYISQASGGPIVAGQSLSNGQFPGSSNPTGNTFIASSGLCNGAACTGTGGVGTYRLTQNSNITTQNWNTSTGTRFVAATRWVTITAEPGLNQCDVNFNELGSTVGFATQSIRMVHFCSTVSYPSFLLAGFQGPSNNFGATGQFRQVLDDYTCTGAGWSVNGSCGPNVNGALGGSWCMNGLMTNNYQGCLGVNLAANMRVTNEAADVWQSALALLNVSNDNINNAYSPLGVTCPSDLTCVSATLTPGSNMLTNILPDTSRFVVGGFIGDSTNGASTCFPAQLVIKAVDPVLRTATMSANANTGSCTTHTFNPITDAHADVYQWSEQSHGVWTMTAGSNQIATAAASVTGVIDNGLGTATGTVFTVSAILNTNPAPLNIGRVLSGTGVTSGTTILAQVSGTPGGVGVYTVDRASQTTAAGETISGAGLSGGIAQTSYQIGMPLMDGGGPGFPRGQSTTLPPFTVVTGINTATGVVTINNNALQSVTMGLFTEHGGTFIDKLVSTNGINAANLFADVDASTNNTWVLDSQFNNQATQLQEFNFQEGTPQKNWLWFNDTWTSPSPSSGMTFRNNQALLDGAIVDTTCSGSSVQFSAFNGGTVTGSISSGALLNGTISGALLTLHNNGTVQAMYQGQLQAGQTIQTVSGSGIVANTTLVSIASGDGQTTGSTWNLNHTSTTIGTTTPMYATGAPASQTGQFMIVTSAVSPNNIHVADLISAGTVSAGTYVTDENWLTGTSGNHGGGTGPNGYGIYLLAGGSGFAAAGSTITVTPGSTAQYLNTTCAPGSVYAP